MQKIPNTATIKNTAPTSLTLEKLFTAKVDKKQTDIKIKYIIQYFLNSKKLSLKFEH